MEPTPELAKAIWWDKVRRARAMTEAERFEDACRLSDFMFDMMRAGIRDRHPQADDVEVERLLRAQLDRIRAVEERGIYRVVEETAE